jgi:regulator of sigma E protease
MVDTDAHQQKDIFGRVHTVRRMGVAPLQASKQEDFVIERFGPIGALKRAAVEMFEITMKTYKALGEMVLGIRSPKEAMGIVGMFFVIKFAVGYGFAFVLHILGVISLSLAIFNLLPIIPLDGGHLLLNGIEKIRGKPLSVKWETVIAKIGLGLMLTLALFVFYADFERIGLIDRIIKLFTAAH